MSLKLKFAQGMHVPVKDLFANLHYPSTPGVQLQGMPQCCTAAAVLLSHHNDRGDATLAVVRIQ